MSFQAVSKWENEQSCPDIALLPLLADVFGVTVDSLFGRQAPEPPSAKEEPAAEQTVRREEEWGDNPVFSAVYDVPWPDDRELRGVVYWGHKLLSHQKPLKKLFTFDVKQSEYTWLLRYSPLNVTAECGLQVEGDIQGNVAAGSHVSCGEIGGDVAAGSHITCADIGGDASAGSHITCADIGNDASAGSHITCVDIGNDASAASEIKCQSIGGDANAEKICFEKNQTT